ncbi:glycerophosphoryl diester phosphodiesterase family protein [Clostridium botulinum C str. Eklund]|nr:glycerophosphoryl diester phosphodiesterase family protein [Clostridium botulinum C str. Eklund]NEZ49167.1 glycerophosphodiester phosphodiesterase [Clostridium botulinum]
MTKNFAHRGFSGKYPENTLLAFEKAIEVGADGIELDVQLTKDNEIVIIHDEDVARTTNGTGLIKDLTYDEISKLDASYIYKDQYGFNKIPTLREYFELIKDTDIITNIELKTGVIEYLGIENKVWDMIQEYKLQDKVIISSFNHFSIMRMRKIAPNLKYGLLSETWLIDAGKYVNNLEIQCYHPLYRNLTNDVVKEIKQYGIEINTYTVNTKEDIEDMISKNIDIIISNFPDLVREVIEEY